MFLSSLSTRPWVTTWVTTLSMIVIWRADTSPTLKTGACALYPTIINEDEQKQRPQ